MNTRKRLAGGTAAVLATALALTACGSDGGTEGGGGGDDGPITWMSMLHTPTTPDPNGPIHEALVDYTGTDFEMQWVPDASKEEKINAALASGTLADITSLTQIDSTTVRNALTSGMFWDVEPYLSEFDNLSQIPQATIDVARLDGHLYGIPFQKPIARYGVLVRQDWLDNLGLETPHTLEELAEVAQAFAEDDPDGNGEDDTTGFIERSESFSLSFRIIAGYFGAGDRFELDDAGNVVPAYTTDAWKEAMEWYRSVYEDGGMNQEFVTMQKDNQRDAIARGEGGIVITGMFEARGYLELAESIDPETPMEWAQINDMTAGDVERRIVSDTNGGMGGWLAINTQTVETEEDLREVLGFIDSLLDEEAFTLMTQGIEDEHYEVDADGVYSRINQTEWEQEVQPYSSSRPADNVIVFTSDNEYVNRADELMAENDEYAVTNPAQSLSSETYDRQWSTIDQTVMDAFNRYMVGELDMAGYEDAIESVRNQGLDDIITEFTESYNSVNG